MITPKYIIVKLLKRKKKKENLKGSQREKTHDIQVNNSKNNSILPIKNSGGQGLP